MRSLASFVRSVAVLVVLWLTALPPVAGGAPADGLAIQVIDGQISINAEAVALGRLLNLFDRVAGTESTVPAQLENRNVSVQFQGLDLGQAVRKIFEGLPLDYVVLEPGQIVVTAEAETLTAGTGSARVPPVNNPVQPAGQPFGGLQPPIAAANPFQSPGANPNAAGNPEIPGAGAQPAVIQTPFGPLVNPRANQAPAMPLAGPGQGYPFGSPGLSVSPPVGTDGQGLFPPSGGRRANDPPPGAAQPGVFGNTAPAILDLKNAQPVFPDRSRP